MVQYQTPHSLDHQKTSNEKNGNPKNAKVLIQKTSDKKTDNPNKRKWAYSKDFQ
jgi:hypothetical protein